MYKGENSHAVNSQSEHIKSHDARKRRRERLSHWFKERGIRIAHVAAELGVRNAVASSVTS
jgi:hypothetical protein